MSASSGSSSTNSTTSLFTSCQREREREGGIEERKEGGGRIQETEEDVIGMHKNHTSTYGHYIAHTHALYIT